jgi:anaerobic magnesium-protoporphyrin IX monomethyl ester cyclase
MRIAIIPVETDTYQDEGEAQKNLVMYDIPVDHLFKGPSMGYLFSGTPIGYLLSYLEQFFPDDLIFPVPDLDFLMKTKPDLVGISAPYSQAFNKAVELAGAIKENLKVPVIMGGQHITYFPKSLPLCVDAGVIGEGEETFRDLINVLKQDGNFNEKNLSKISGIVFHQREQKVITLKRKLISDIDSIPLSRKFFYQATAFWLPTVCTGRGSPVKSLNTQSTDPVRLHSAERMMGDFIDIITYYPDSRYISITDELFLHDIKRLRRFAEIVVETNLTKYFRFNVTALPEQLTEEVLYILKHSLDVNVLNIFFSGINIKTQRELKEPVIGPEAQAKILERCYKYSLKTVVNFLLGAPGETREDMAKNYWFIRQNTTKIYNNFTIKNRLYIPYPGTEAWSKAIIKRLLNDNLREWEILDENILKKETPLINPSCSYEELAGIINLYRDLNIKPKKLKFSPRDQHNEMIDKIVKVAEEGLESFVEKSSDKGYLDGVSGLYDIKTYFNLVAPLLEKLNMSVIETLEQLFRNHDIESIAQVKEPISKIMDEFQRYNKTNDVNNLVTSKEVFTLAIPDILEQIIRNNDVKTVLQITDPLITDLSNILSYEKIEVDTLLPKVFNNAKLRLNFEKKYDCIVLIYTLDIFRHPHKILRYCNKILNDHGNLIITFFNAKCAISLNQLINLDISELFYTYNRLNLFTYESMTQLLKTCNFIPKKIVPILYPDKDHMSYAQMMIVDSLKKHFELIDADYTTFSYTYSCRKQTGRGFII